MRAPTGDTLRQRLPTSRTLGFFLTVAALTCWVVYDAFFHRGYTLGKWLAEPLDWLFILSVVVFAFHVAYPMAVARERTHRQWQRYRRNPVAVAALVGLVAFVLVGALGPAVMKPLSLDYLHSYQPPVWGSVDADVVDKCAGQVVDGRCHGSWQYPLGTDRNGYRVGRLVVAATHVSLYVAAITSMLIVPIALAVGTAAGYVGGLVDSVLMRYVEIQDTIPAIVVYLLLIFWYDESLLLIVLLFGFLSWGGVARLVRSEVLQRTSEEYVLAGKSVGGTDGHVVLTHVVPNVMNTAITATMQQVPLLILTEAGIAFLGLEAHDLQSFGNVITRGLTTEGMGPAFQTKWWVSTVPAVALAVVVVSFKLVGDATRDALDPRE